MLSQEKSVMLIIITPIDQSLVKQRIEYKIVVIIMDFIGSHIIK